MESKDKNPNLDDVLNSIITGVSRGRQSADIEAIKMALEYNKIDLLKGLPAPRMRINNIQVNLPVLIGKSTSGTVAKECTIEQIISPAQASTMHELEIGLNGISDALEMHQFHGDLNSESALSLLLYQDFFTSLKKMYSSSKELLAKDLKLRLENAFTKYKLATDDHLSSAGIKEVVSESLEGNLNTVFETAILSALKAKAKKSSFTVDAHRGQVNRYLENQHIVDLIARVKYSVLPKCVEVDDSPPQQMVVAETDAIKNKGGGPDMVTRISFVLREEGLEWTKEIGDNNSEISTLSIA